MRLTEKLNNNKKKESQNAAIHLPDDFTYHLPDDVKAWLKQYGITNREIFSNCLGWSESNGHLIYPCFDIYGNLLCYQGRNFRHLENSPRFITRGPCEKIYHILENNPNYPSSVCLVEDMVSCIKVARHVSCMPLFGSTIQVARFVHLGNRFKHLILWLDKDKALYAVKRSKVAETFFDTVHVIITEKDPKDYDDGQLRRYLIQS